MSLHTKDFDYHLPENQIAQYSVEPRDHAKMMVVGKASQELGHKHFYDIVDVLQKGDVLVWNNSKVFKARLRGKLLTRNNEGLWHHKREVEVFLVRPMENLGVWKVLAKPGRHVKHGTRVMFDAESNFYCDVLVRDRSGAILVQFPFGEDVVRGLANRFGGIPIPPYVKHEPQQIESYQTVYAKEEGSVAAPTAGFHFTPTVIERLQEKGVIFAEVTLHVGLGTFLPVKTEKIADHTMHSEWVELSKENAEIINTAKKEGRRVIAVGTTSVRTLEGIASLPLFTNNNNTLPAFSGDINIFITPGFSFRIIDGLITNFHLPKSTLLMLVSAFIGDREYTLDCYNEAVKEGYRFFSFGDSMVIV